MSSYTEKKISLRLKVSNCSPFQKALITIYITFFPLHLISIGQKGCFSQVKPHATKQKVFYLKVNQTDPILRRTETKYRCSQLKFGNKKQTHFLRQPPGHQTLSGVQTSLEGWDDHYPIPRNKGSTCINVKFYRATIKKRAWKL